MCLTKAVHPTEIMHNRKENEHVENLIFDVAAGLRPCNFVRQSCEVHLTAATRNPEICRRRQVQGRHKADVKQAESRAAIKQCGSSTLWLLVFEHPLCLEILSRNI